jgi:Sulfatase
MTARVIKILQAYPFYTFLLPVFFVLHNFMQYYGLVAIAPALVLLIEIELLFLAGFMVIRLLTRNTQRSAQLMMLTGSIALFYGVLKDFLSHTAAVPFLARYSILLPLLLVISVLVIIRIFKKKDFSKTNYFQNAMLLLFLLAEAAGILFSGVAPYLQQNQLVKKSGVNPDSIPVSTERPDVYFLVFDSYPGPGFLKELLQYSNAGLDTVLQARGFYIAANPRSNYIHTAFSMAATLNFQYLQNMVVNRVPEPMQYNQASLSIKNAAVPAIFYRMGYRFYNLSIFDAGKQPALQKENFLVLPPKDMLLYNTLGARFSRDVLWNFSGLVNKFLETGEDRKNNIAGIEKEYTQKRDYNNRVIDSLLHIPFVMDTVPRFVYAHFYLPHPPFFYERDGHPVNRDLASVVKSMEDKQAFLSYLEYTNTVIRRLTDTILRHSSRPPVIIIQSDHGYRDFKKDQVDRKQYYKNYSAFYFPDRQYGMLYDSFSNVNTFPVLFNKYFNTRIPLQKDSCVLMRY